MKMIARTVDWSERLNSFLAEQSSRPLKYGQNDCCLFIADAVLVQTGDDFGAPFRGRYRSVAGAVRALRTIGGGDMRHVVSAALGAPVHPAFAGFGDVVEFPDGIFGIHARTHAIVLSVYAGLVNVSLAASVRAWGLPHV